MSSSSMSSVDTEAASTLLVCEGNGQYRPASTDEVLRRARYLLSRRCRKGAPMDSPRAAKDYLRVSIGTLEHEVFCVVFLDSQHRLIVIKELFRGSIAQTTVYPREVIKEALSLNAAAVFLAHNHPSGDPEPSRADQLLTETLTAALRIVEVRVLDHLVVTCDDVVSLAERGLL